jgi:hypothetical protein
MYKYKTIVIPEIKKNIISNNNIFFNNGYNNKGPNNNGPKIILVGLIIIVIYHNYRNIKKYN